MKVLLLLLSLALLVQSTLAQRSSVTLSLQNAASGATIGPFAIPAAVDIASTPQVRFLANVKDVRLPRLGVSVVYTLDGKTYSTDNSAPFVSSDWPATVGPHTLTATVHRRNNGRGRTLTSITVPFNVVNNSMPAPVAPKAMVPTPIAPTTPVVAAPAPTPAAPTGPVASPPSPVASPPTPTASNTPAPVTPGMINIVINEIMRNPIVVFDDKGEWMELYNAGTVAVNLFNWTIKDKDTDSFVITTNPLILQPGAYAVIANNNDAATNGGLPYVNFTFVNGVVAGTMSLGNGDDELILIDANGIERDRVDFWAAAGFPTPNGASIALRQPTLDNTNGANWCVSSSSYGSTEKGTPGRANDCLAAPTAPSAPAPMAPTATPPTTPGSSTRIHTIQGSGSTATNVGATLPNVTGLVTAIFTAEDVVAGFYLQEPDATIDGNALTSEGIFVSCKPKCTTPAVVAPGDLVTAINGVVAELFGTTSLDVSGASSSYTIVSRNNALPTPIALTLPAATSTKTTTTYEAYEGMLVTFPSTLVVSEYFQLGRFGQLVLTESALRPYQYTNNNAPSVSGYAAYMDSLNKRRIFLDDDNDDENDSIKGATANEAVFYPSSTSGLTGLSLSNKFRGGDTIVGLTGVMQYAFNAWRIRPVQQRYNYTFNPVNARTLNPPNVGTGRIRVASFNVLNYFTTQDDGPDTCSPSGKADCRGADSDAELVRQRDKIVAAMVKLNADVFGLIEMENSNDDGPATNLVTALNTALGSTVYAVVATGAIGTDAIRCGFIYKSTTMSLTSAYKVLNSSVDANFFDFRNRPVVIQTFTEINGGAKLTVAVNHFKSKGSSCANATVAAINDPDLNDGQANCPVTRTKAAVALVNYLKTDPTGSADADYLIIGDLNSYAKEEPIAALLAANYTNLLNATASYGYVFDGQLGSLDYALASPSLVSQVTGAAEWHINADEVQLFDYNDDVQDSGESDFERESNALPLYAADPYRSSDHDPVVVALNLVA